MSKSSKKAWQERPAQADQPAMPEAQPEGTQAEETAPEPVADASPTLSPDAPTAEMAPEPAPAVEVAPEPEPVAATPKGKPWTDLKREPGTVPCVALVAIMWLGETLQAGASLMVPASNVDRLERKGLVKKA